jgi:hypothetical protein
MPFVSTGFSIYSSFTGSRATFVSRPHSTQGSNTNLVMYDDSRPDAWTVLANTERWISQTLSSTPGNPYARKEVSYVCEAADESALIVANIFKRLKEARELGETHGEREVQREEKEGTSLSIEETNLMVQ